MEDAVGAVQSVLVLGGSSEIGLAIARALVEARTRTVVLAARHPGRLDAAVEQLRALGAERVEAVAFDATATETHENFVDDVFARTGDVDLVVIAFGVLGNQAEAEADGRTAAEIAVTNYVGVVSVCPPLVRRLRGQGHGAIVGLSSVAGERARRSNFVYGSSMAGMDAYMQGLGDTLAGSGVRVMVVRPGFVKPKTTTGKKPMPMSTTPEKVAAAVVRGLARHDVVIWVPPALRAVMVVVRHLPRAIFRRLPV